MQRFELREIPADLFVLRVRSHLYPVNSVQSRSRAWQARQRYLAARERVILLQSFCRSHQAQSVRRQAIRATIVLQSFVRMSIARKELLRAMSAARLMQSLTRTVQARKMYRHQRASTFLLQARFLTHVRHHCFRMVFVVKHLRSGVLRFTPKEGKTALLL